MAHAVEISLVLNSPEKQREFREKVMDSLAFWFTRSIEPMTDEPVGMNDILGVCLRPEFEVYATQTLQGKFLLRNRSGGRFSLGHIILLRIGMTKAYGGNYLSTI